MSNVLITGGARSGKSSFAENIYNEIDDVVYIATYVNDDYDQEMSERVSLHQQQRNSNWKTYEVNNEMPDIYNKNILIDCLSIYTSNMLYKYTKDIEYISYEIQDKIINEVVLNIKKLLDNQNKVVIVTNEVGYSLVPINHLERVYRDILGHINKKIALLVDDVYLVVCGQNIKIK